MIKYFTIFNCRGQPRLKRIYTEEDRFTHEYLQKVVNKCLCRNETLTSVFEHKGDQVTYRKYAGLVVVVGMDSNENEMAIYEFIHTFMSCVNLSLKQLTEIELTSNIEKVYSILDKMLVAGVVCNTNTAQVLYHLV